MQTIDFLPVEYRQRHARRQSQPWRIVVVAAFGLLLAVAAFSQYYARGRVKAELSEIEPAYQLALSQNKHLAELQSQLSQHAASAKLLTYLRHPWPRSQLLAALLTPLPEEVVFEQLQIVREAPLPQSPAEPRVQPEKSSEAEDLSKLLPAERDLKVLREQLDKLRTVIHLAGTTPDSAALHRYLGELGKNRLWAKVELDSLESTDAKGGTTMRFRATLMVRPGYGQAGGPTPSEQHKLAQGPPTPPPQPLP